MTKLNEMFDSERVRNVRVKGVNARENVKMLTSVVVESFRESIFMSHFPKVFLEGGKVCGKSEGDSVELTKF